MSPQSPPHILSKHFHFNHAHLLNNMKLVPPGDFNLPNVNWLSLSSTTTTGSLTCDVDLINLKMITDHTHIHGGIPNLDVTNHPEAISNIIN